MSEAAPPPPEERPRREVALETAIIFGVVILPKIVASVDTWWSAHAHAAAATAAAVPPGGDGDEETGSGPSHPAARLISVLLANTPRDALVLYTIWRAREMWARFGLTLARWPARASVPFLTDLALGLAIFRASLTWREWIRAGLHALESAAPHAARAAKHAAPRLDALDVALLVALAIVVALHEELVYRAWLVTRLERILATRWGAVLLGAVVFSLAHVGLGAYGASRTLVSGTIYGASLVLTRRFWPGVVAHALNDAWAFIG